MQVVDCKQTDGGKDSRWRGTFRWSDDLNQANTDFFANSAFRPNQREAINATMSGKDCFVLMPTGGGDLLLCNFGSVISERQNMTVKTIDAIMSGKACCMVMPTGGYDATHLKP